MKNISTQYQDLLEGKMTKHQFLRNARMMFPSFVTNHNSFADSVSILKTKGMLVEGNAVKGTPDKTPEYDYPTQPGKYKKVEQSPEVDEQDGIYPATTLTDIPKEEVSKPIKSKTRPDGLEDIKNNDTKNEMKKVKVVKENLRSFDDIFGDFIETDDATEIKTYIKTKGKEAISKIKSKLPALKDTARTKLAKLMKIELDEARLTKETQIDEVKVAPDAQAVIDLVGKNTMLLNKLKNINNKEELQPIFDFLLTKINQTIAKNTQQVKTATTTSAQNYSKMGSIKEKLKPAITKLVQEVLDEMGTDE
jgi:hypothetical protein